MPLAPTGQPLANFGDRLVAYLIDAAVLFGVGLVLAIPTFIGMFAAIAGAASTTGSTSAGLALGLPLLIELLFVLAMFVVSYVYYVEMFGKTGVTWGKRAMKIQPIRLDNPGLPLDRGVLAKRWATQVLGGLLPFFSWVDGLWQLWDKPYLQCLHDKAAGTIVVKVG